MHAIDNLGGKLGSFDRLEKGLQDGETWSQYDRALEGSAWFPRRTATPRAVAAAAAAPPPRASSRAARAGADLAAWTDVLAPRCSAADGQVPPM